MVWFLNRHCRAVSWRLCENKKSLSFSPGSFFLPLSRFGTRKNGVLGRWLARRPRPLAHFPQEQVYSLDSDQPLEVVGRGIQVNFSLDFVLPA